MDLAAMHFGPAIDSLQTGLVRGGQCKLAANSPLVLGATAGWLAKEFCTITGKPVVRRSAVRPRATGYQSG